MKQSRLATLFETIGGTALGFVVALGVQAVICWLYALPLTLLDNLGIIGVFTIVSLIRGYAWRRACEALHVRRRLSPAMQAAIAERFRQIEGEGYNHAHDDVHALGDLACAGAAYIASAAAALEAPPGAPGYHAVESARASLLQAAHTLWPWQGYDFKPHGYRRDLVRGCALILADIEKLDRNRGKVRS